MRLLFAPFSIVSGLVAGLLAKKAFDRAWRAADGDAPPEAKERDASLGRLAAALAIQGAVFKLVKGLADQGARRAFARATGTWPGEKRKEG